MFCDRCGSTVEADQRFCGRCGKGLFGDVVAARPMQSRVQEHLRLVAILWLALSALTAIAGVVLCVLGNALFPHLHEMGAPPEVPVSLLVSLFTAIGTVVLIKAGLGFVAGWGLLRHEPWARMLTIVLSFLALLNIPFGTALGIYSLWVLLPSQSEREYQQATMKAGLA